MTGIDCQWSLKLASLLGNKRLIPATNSSEPMNMNIKHIHQLCTFFGLHTRDLVLGLFKRKEIFVYHCDFQWIIFPPPVFYQQQADDRQSMSDAVTVDKQLELGRHRNNGWTFPSRSPSLWQLRPSSLTMWPPVTSAVPC